VRLGRRVNLVVIVRLKEIASLENAVRVPRASARVVVVKDAVKVKAVAKATGKVARAKVVPVKAGLAMADAGTIAVPVGRSVLR
jgi:hypothetical protein